MGGKAAEEPDKGASPESPGSESSRTNPWLVLGGILLVLAIAIPNFRAARARPGPRACFANQKTILGAVEMYNLDFNANVDQLTPEILGKLVEKGYLRSIPNDPGAGEGSSGNYRLIAVPPCEVHRKSPDRSCLACRRARSPIECRVHGPIHGRR